MSSSAGMPGKPRKATTKRDTIAKELRAMIESGQLARGARVQQDELAARFNTSITPVREAMRELEAEGLLVSEPHRGVRVSEVNVDELQGVYVARRLLEPFAAALATQNISRRELALMQSHLDAMEAASRDHDSPGLWAANRDFHFVIYQACGIPRLVSQIEGLWLGFPWDVLEVLGDRSKRSVDEHQAILAGLRDGDSAATAAACEQHLRNSFHALVAHLSGAAPVEDPFDLVGSAE
jgi:DNA-binding GntR family transcriptional regulator